MKKYTLVFVFSVFVPLGGMQSDVALCGSYVPASSWDDFLEKNVANCDCVIWAFSKGVRIDTKFGCRLIHSAVCQHKFTSVVALLMGGLRPDIIDCSVAGDWGHTTREVSFAMRNDSCEAGLIWRMFCHFKHPGDVYRTVQEYKKLGVPEVEAALLVMKTSRVISVMDRLVNDGDFFFLDGGAYYFVPRKAGTHTRQDLVRHSSDK